MGGSDESVGCRQSAGDQCVERGWRRLDPMLPEHLLDGGVRAALTQLEELALNSACNHSEDSPCHPHDQLDQLRVEQALPPSRSSAVRGPLSPNQVPMPAEEGIRARD